MKRKGRSVLKPDFKLRVDKAIRDIRNSLYELHEIAIRDEKTGIYNHNFFKTVFGMEIEKAKKGKEEFCLAIVDIDFFKKVNDTYGHMIGDEVLIELARFMNSCIRKYDVLARFGGEEFLILLPETSPRRAKQIMERIRGDLWKNAMLKKYKITVSVGIARYKERDNMERLIKRADKGLYYSKEHGRNQTTVCD